MLRAGRTGKINSWLAKGDKWIPAVFFCCVLALYLTMLANFVFVDELDVFYGGYNIVKSGDLYRFYPSQHMPFSYYIAAIGALLGANTVARFRLFFYVFLSGLWTGIYLRNRKVFPRLALLMMPLLYIVQLWMHDLATTMISDHWQGMGILIILLELLRYAEEKKISAGVACMIALGISLSFGTTFLSAYPLLIVFLGVVAMQAVRVIRKEQKLSAVLAEDFRLALICLCPFLLLGLWYAVSGNLGNAVGGAYDLNVNIYSKYLGGFGTDAGGTFFEAFPNWLGYQAKGLSYLNRADWRWALQIFLQTGSLMILVICLFKEKQWIAGITFPLAVILTGVRAFDGFHGAPYMAVCCIPMTVCFAGALEFFLAKRSWTRAIPAALALVLAAAFVLPAAGIAMRLGFVPKMLNERQYRESNRDVLEILAEPGERIHTDDLYFSGQTVMRNNLSLAEASLGAGNPWFWEFYGERELNTLKENQTRLLVMDLEGEIWGYKLRDYAADLVTYVEENYTNIGPNLYIRNEAYPAALARLREAGYGTVYAGPSFGADSRIGGKLESGTVCEQRITAAGTRMTGVRILLGTYLNQNKAGVTVQLADAAGEIIGESNLPKDEIRDNFYTRFALSAETEPGQLYTLRIQEDGTAPEGEDIALAMYCYPTAENAGAVLNGVSQDYDWAVVAEYEAD